MIHQRHIQMMGGLSFILGALAFTLVFSFLAASFNYPDVLHGNAATVLGHLLAGGEALRGVWAIYALLPLFLLPAGAGHYTACPNQRAAMALALMFISIAAISMCLGLMRWPSIHWVLAEAYAQAQQQADTASMHSIAALFDGLNLYLGNYIGEFLGESCLAAFFLISGYCLSNESRFPKWLGIGSMLFAVLFMLGAFRNVCSSVQIIADINNLLLPVWMIVLGSGLIWFSRTAKDSDTVTN